MISLLVLSLVLSTPSASVQSTVVSSDPLAIESQRWVAIHPEMALNVEESQSESFDAMAIHPDTDICYKIRAYIFSTGPMPKFLRETTCGPKREELKRLEGAKPKLVPIDAKGDTTTGTNTPH
ncbi:MAG TPA: hypothetical protein VII23_22865 [Terriglobales bacterium]